MKFTQALRLLAAFGFAAALANAGKINFLCDGSVDVATCDYLNNNVAGDYNNTFVNANASVYIRFGDTGLASTTTARNFLSFTDFQSRLQNNYNTWGDAVQGQALTALSNIASDSYYGSNGVKITSAEGRALGIAAADLTGVVAAANNICTIGTAGCYDGVITMSGTANFFYDQNAGSIGPSQYDFYGAVEHELNEILGTSSCIRTSDPSGKLTDPCDTSDPNNPVDVTGLPSAIDLFRYTSLGNLAFNNSVIGLTGAAGHPYFSYDGGATNGANGFLYNTAANGQDYADFLTVCTGPSFSIQNATGCPGKEQGLSILNDGGGEINILRAAGYDLAPEPGTLAVCALGIGLIAFSRFRRALSR
jgi:hypothetical protein